MGKRHAVRDGYRIEENTMTPAQLQAQQRVINILMEQSITNFYLSYDESGHKFYSQSSAEPLFVAATNAELLLAFRSWCHSTPNDDIGIIVTAF